MDTQPQIQAEIDALRERITHTPTLYREVCMLLFFRYGITPTGNMLYRYVKKGSMSAPAEALRNFWDELREKSRVRIEQADVPEELKADAGNLVASLWTKAQTAAQEGLRTLRVEAHTAVVEANTVVASAADLARQLEKTRQSFQMAAKRVLLLEQELAAERAARAAMAMQLDATVQQRQTFDPAWQDASSCHQQPDRSDDAVPNLVSAIRR